MRIRLEFDRSSLVATLAENATARDFASLLPLSLTLEDYAATEKISDLPRRLSTTGAPAAAAGAVGDLAYYAPWGNLAVFYRAAPRAAGLVTLGRIEGDLGPLRDPGSHRVTITRVKE